MPEATATLHLVSELPATAGTCAMYASADRPPPGWRDVDVRARCHRHQQQWGNALTSWHGEMMTLAAAATTWAWLLPGSRIHVWQPQIRPLLFALGLHDFFREHPAAEVWATGCPPELADYIAEFSNGAVRIVRHDRPRAGLAARARSQIDRLRDTVSVLRRIPVRARAPVAERGADVVVYSLALSARSVRERGDHYFGRALDDGFLKTHWLYQLVGSADRARIEAAVRQTGRSVTWAHDCVGWREALSLLRIMANARRDLRRFVQRVPPLRISGVTSCAFARRFVEQLLVNGPMLGELVVFHATRAMLRAVRPAAVCYPYEEKGMEHAIALAAEAEPGCRTIGFAHAAYASGYLYLAASPASAAPPPRPQMLAAAGEGLGAWLKSEFGRHDRVVHVGSPRWTPPPLPARDHAPGRPLRVLVLTSFAYELGVMADWIEAQPHVFDGMSVTIRPNPKDWPREQSAAFKRLRGAAAVAIDGGLSLEAQIDACDVAVFCATSAVAEVIWQGRIAVYAEWSDLWATDPTKGKGGAQAVPKCASANALREELLAIGRLERAAYARVVAAQREVAAQIYAKFDRVRFHDLVMEPMPT